MSIGTKIIIFALTCCSAVLSFGQVADFAINISTPQSSVRTGTDIPVGIKVSNVSNHELPIFVSPGESGIALAFDISVLDESMEKVLEMMPGYELTEKLIYLELFRRNDDDTRRWRT